MDGANNLDIVDSGAFARKVDPAGIITTVADLNDWDSKWGEGPAVEALPNSVVAVAVDSAGNLYIAEKLNCRIYRVDSTGTINTIARRKCGKDSWAPGQVVEGVFRDIEYVTVDGAGNLYAADGRRIHKLPQLGMISENRNSGSVAVGTPVAQVAVGNWLSLLSWQPRNLSARSSAPPSGFSTTFGTSF